MCIIDVYIEPRGHETPQDGCEDEIHLTVSVDVVVALVPQAVRVCVLLCGVLYGGTVVTGISMGVLIAVPLVLIGDKPTVVLCVGQRELGINWSATPVGIGSYLLLFVT